MNNNEPYIEPLTPQEAEEDWLAIIARIRAHEAKKRKRKITRFVSAIAASILLLIGTIITYRMYVLPDIYFAKDNDLAITLTDNSHITLSKGAKLTVYKTFPSDTRDVFLEGNAVFKVSKSKEHPFIVHAGSYEAKVLGTVFKVVQTGATFKVDLYEGKVQVSNSTKSKESYIIRPKETFSNMGSNQVATVAPTVHDDFKKKKISATLAFTDFYLQDALKIIERTYGIKIIFPEDRASSKISILSKDATVDQLMENISIQLNLNIKKANVNTFELEE
ncbi:FecR family protein [Chryseobacterium indologenes]|uniref:FecR family protein n=1 Tax=Chryseobacterium indologenes TaxID=253 RepID=A0AAD0YUC1_CHRID|nr:FecR family protein [Chryseobacterium indologenes]AZB17480.1 FecR family protein [Chryseobacterium indologenes]